jgi:hypothetical protein
MKWDVEASDEFVDWYNALDDDEGKSVDTAVDMLAEYGPSLGRPYADTLSESKYQNMKGLRVQHQGRPYRILFAFDPRRNAYLILGGDKTGKNDWYEWAVPQADKLYTQHLKEIGGQKNG